MQSVFGVSCFLFWMNQNDGVHLDRATMTVCLPGYRTYRKLNTTISVAIDIAKLPMPFFSSLYYIHTV